MHYTHLSNASGKFVAPIMTTPSLGLKLYEKKGQECVFIQNELQSTRKWSQIILNLYP